MNRLLALLVLALFMETMGCAKRKANVVATFVFPVGTATRIVLFDSGDYEQWMTNDGVPKAPYRRSWEHRITLHGIEAKERTPPIETGTWLMGTGRLDITVSANRFHTVSWPTNRAYQVVGYAGFEYLFDERGRWAQKYRESNDTNVLRYAWRQEALTNR